MEQGARVDEVISAADYDDFSVSGELLWRTRAALVRVHYRPLSSGDVNRLAEIAADRGYADAVVIEAGAAALSAPAPNAAVQVVRAQHFISQLEAAALVAWSEGSPFVDQDLFTLLRQRANLFERFDVLGLRYLPWLSRNKKPRALRNSRRTADELFEEYVFRLFTAGFRFRGRLLGARQRGSPEPDALLFFPSGDAAAVIDCKAARDGFKMDAATYRALRDYTEQQRLVLQQENRTLAYVVIVSSSFAGVHGARHPYHARAKKLADETATKLVYVEADELVRFAITLDERQLNPVERESVDWKGIFEAGMPRQAAFRTGIQ